MEKKRTLSEILIEADNTESLNVLSSCWEEVRINRYSFTVAELKYATEHIEDLTKSMARRDSAIIKQLISKL